MLKYFKKLFPVPLVSSWLLWLPFLARAQSQYDNPIDAESIDQLVTSLLSVITTLIEPLAVIAIMVAAFLYITAGGVPEKVSRAHKAIIWAVVGIVIVLMSTFLKDVVIGVTGTTGASTLEDFLYEVADGLGTILMGLSVLFVMYSSFLFMTGGQEPEKITMAKKTLIYALVGVAVALLAFFIPKVIGDIFTP
jgi:type IV secretory pathway VirB2 component (pilin)